MVQEENGNEHSRRVGWLWWWGGIARGPWPDAEGAAGAGGLWGDHGAVVEVLPPPHEPRVRLLLQWPEGPCIAYTGPRVFFTTEFLYFVDKITHIKQLEDK